MAKKNSVKKNSAKRCQLIPFTVTANLPCATITIEGEEIQGKVIFRKKLEGQCQELETFEDCVDRLAQFVITYGELLSF